MKKVTKTAVVLSASLLMFSCGSDKAPETSNTEETKEVVEVEVKETPDFYPLKEVSLYPEGITYNEATKTTYVGSYFQGKIITVDLDGNMTDFVTDESLVAVVGMVVDNANNRLLVCNSDAGISLKSDPSTTGQIAQVIAYDLTTGEKIKTIDLSQLFPGGHFLNDIVLDADGNMYITDSFSPVVYKINTNDEASVLVTNAMFEVPQGTFGLNGIVYHKDGYLIVGRSYGGLIYKIPLNNPEEVTEIKLNAAVNSLDGLLLIDGNTLALASNYFAGPAFDEAIYKIETTDNWASGNVANTFSDLDGKYPTTMTEINSDLYVSFGYFPELIDPTTEPNDNFKLQKVKF